MKRLIDPTADATAKPALLKLALRAPRRLTARLRLMPDFIIIGGQRCGTTTLFGLLAEHPCMVPPLRKEVHFFARNFHRGVDWYRSFFPLALSQRCAHVFRGRAIATGEATAYYIFHPHAAKRIHHTLPHVKLIALLRNPVDRAHSHYHHEVRKGRETLSFEDAIRSETSRLESEREKMLEDERYDSRSYCYYSYLSRGIYADQLPVWLDLFPREQLLILRSEDLYTQPSGILREALEFLGMPRWELPRYRNYNEAQYPPMAPATRRWLVEYFKPHNRRLYEFLGRDFGWDE